MDMPDFLQSKQSDSSNRLRSLFKDRKKLSIVVLVILLLAIPMTVSLLQRAQIFSPRAGSAPIELVTGGDSCVISDGKVSCPSFPIRLTSPLGPLTLPSVSPSPHNEPGATCTSDSQCSAGQECFNQSPYPGTCREIGTVCAEVVTRACNPANSNQCVDFGNPCYVPPGWIVSNNSSPSPNSNSCENDSQCPSGQSCQVVNGACTGSVPPHCIEFKECRPIGFKSPIPSASPSDSVPPSATPSPSPVVCSNLVKNGSFENTAITNPLGWTIFGATDQLAAQDSRATTQNIADWNGRTSPATYQVELQKNLFGQASNGSQYAEIDQPGIVSLTQNITTEANKQYQIKFDYSPRTDRNTPQKMGVYWNDQQVGIIDGTTHGSSLSWQVKSFVVTANSANSKLGFGALSDSTPEAGNFIDNVTITLVSNACTSASATTSESAKNLAEKLYSSVNDFKFVSKVEAQSNMVCPSIVKNGGFESTPVTNPIKWTVFGATEDLAAQDSRAVTQNIADWNPRVNTAKYQVELQKSLFGPAPEGTQYAEVDQPGIVSLNQNLTTETNRQYIIKFDYSPRTDRNTPQKMGVFWNDQQLEVIDGTSHGSELAWQTKTYTVTATSTSSRLAFGAMPDSSEGAGNFIDNVSVSLADCGGSSPSPTTSTSNSPSSTPSGGGTTLYKLAESEAGLATASAVPYTQHPTITNFTFSDATKGVKQIWAEFFGPNGVSRKEHISVELVGLGPVLNSLDCSMDISKQNLKVVLNGSELGNSGGKVSVSNKDAEILSWNSNQVVATIKPEGNLDEGKQFSVKLTKNDNTVLPEAICRVNTTLISLGARLFCREPGKFDVNGVKATLVDGNGTRVNEEVSIDANGIVQGLKTKLQVGQPYSISIKAPFSLRRNSEFTAADGTNIMSPEDDSIFILPIGDIAPVILPDGKINTVDRAELVRQWSVLGLGSTQKAGDFNRDSRVNSIDWACMRFDFNKEDDGIPSKAGLPGPSSSPLPSYAASIAPSTQPSSNPSNTPQPSSGQSSAFFLLQPFGGGSYENGDDFFVDLNVSSENEAANLFVAKMTFDKTAMEVLRIEKGTSLTTWAEEFLDNDNGRISLVAGKPTPGLKTSADTPVRMARIVFRSKKVGTTTIRLTNESKIYSDSNNANILNTLNAADIEIR